MDDIDKRLRMIFLKEFCVVGGKITPQASIAELGLDSLDRSELMIQIEHEFRFEIPDEDAEKLMTFADVDAYVRKRLA